MGVQAKNWPDNPFNRVPPCAANRIALRLRHSPTRRLRVAADALSLPRGHAGFAAVAISVAHLSNHSAAFTRYLTHEHESTSLFTPHRRARSFGRVPR